MKAPPKLARALGLAASGTALMLFILLWALAAGTGQQVVQLLLLGLAFGLLLLMLPLGSLLVLLLLVTFVLQGTANYFLRFHQAQWLPYLLCILLSVRAFELRSPSPVAHGASGPAWSTPPVVCVLLYGFALVASSLIFRPPLGQLIVALKNALPMWVAAALVFQGARMPGVLDRLWSVMRWVFFLQLPIVLLQHFVILRKRHDALTTGVDGVVGSFGGLIDAGGANATLVVFTLTVMAYQLGLWLRRECSSGRLLLYWGTGLAIILAGEVKAALIWLPLVVLYVARKRVFASFGSAAVALVVSGVMVVGLYGAYRTLYWQNYKVGANADLLSRAEYFFDADNINTVTGEISRGASIALWVRDPAADLATRVVGYGPGASRISATGGLGKVAQRYAPLQVSSTTASLLLWDSGLLGAAGFLGAIFFTALMLRRHAADRRLGAREQAGADALGATLLIMLSLYFYNHYLNDEPSTQLLLALALGVALHLRAASAARSMQETAPPQNRVARWAR